MTINKFILVLLMFSSFVTTAQIVTQAATESSVTNSSVLMDGSTYYSAESGAGNNVGKGIVVPSVDLLNFEFDLTYADGLTFPTYFDGMIVYNNASGTTLTTGVRSSTATAVVPGFYYFSNPNGASNGNVTSGTWQPLGGGSGIKSKTVEVVVPANPTTATLDLGTSVIAASEVNSFLGAKIYDNSGNLVMTADSAYNKATNLLTTGNGIMYQVLPAGTYQVVVDYK